MQYRVQKVSNADEYISQALGYREIFHGNGNPNGNLMWLLHSVVPLQDGSFWVISYVDNSEKK